MTNKEFKGLLEEVSMSVYVIAKTLNEQEKEGVDIQKLEESFDRAYVHYVDRMNNLLLPFSVKANSMILQSVLVRIMSFKKDKTTGEKCFQVTGSAVRDFVQKQILSVYCPNWKEQIVSAKKGKKSTEEQLTALLAKAKSEHIDITALVEKAREAEKVAA